MKFSHQLQFNAVPDWADYYLPYSNLKKLVYSTERDRVAAYGAHRPSEDDFERGPSERTALISPGESTESLVERENSRFIQALDQSLDKIVKFYTKKEQELYKESNDLLHDLDKFQYEGVNDDHDDHWHASPNFPRRESTTVDDDLPPNIISQNVSEIDPQTLASCHHDTTELRKRTIDLFVLLSELKSFVALNQTAFSKILKKYDKITHSNLKRYYVLNHVSPAYPFKSSTKQALNDRIQRTERVYAALVTEGDLDLAITDLKTHLRERIVWERNMVWRDMIGQERKVQSVGVSEAKPISLPTPCGTFHVHRDQIFQGLFLFISLVVFAFLLRVNIFDQEEQNLCFAILVFASMLWAGEVMPLFVTALVVPFLIVLLRVMRSEDGTERLSAPDATKRVFASMFSPVIMLLLGGFTIAGALSKFGIAKSMATFVLSKAGTRPNRVLLVNMFVATIASMWISNVAAPVLCFSLIQPILRTLPVDSTFGPCLIMGIALSSNLGGMASPISSPQNVIAIQNMSPPPTWGEWFFASIPLCIVGNLIIWLWLLWNYNPEKHTPQIHEIRASHDPITLTQVYVAVVTFVTIVLWCLAHTYEDTFGDMGVIAIIPLVAFFGPGLLTKDDFNNFLWNVIMLAMGGIALGKAVESSGLLQTIATQIEELVTGMSAFEILFVFSSLVLVMATFISHTVAALIVLPIVAEVGAHLDDPRPRLLVMGTAFMCSSAMGLPVSGFPNMNAISQENELGQPYLSTKDFLVNGVPSSVFAMLCVTTLGYGLMSLMGF
ncbi:SPX domain-containing protein [Phascolomyces articulosus]|uniref:SPX domain-containing protein n=1 Tax=Phascolomyces articulosus TaxID=60185 RepID=A0AAD5K474_9FUNG|nr:SPX domain-containing protein [Phascolomyces articulosus]